MDSDSRDWIILGLVGLALYLLSRGGQRSTRFPSLAGINLGGAPSRAASSSSPSAAGTGGYGVAGSPGSIPAPSATGSSCGCGSADDPYAGVIPSPVGDYTAGTGFGG